MDEFRLLGPLEVVVDGAPVPLPAAKPRALLALLLLNRNRAVSTERLIDALWSDDPPAQATKTLQVYVSQLRKALGAERLVTRPPGYLLRVDAGELDLERFEQLTANARTLAPVDARAALTEALALWRGSPEPVVRHLEELHASAYEDWLAACVDAGDAVVPQLEEVVSREPLRERPRELLMLALYRAGRQADALDLYRRTRDLFVEELGIEPGPRLRELEQAMLRHDTDLRLKPVPRETKQPPRRRRRLWLAAALGVVAVAAGIAGALLARGSGSSADTELRSFVFTLENFLAQSHDGRVAVTRVLDDAFACRAKPRVAAARLNTVQENRQSLLQQLAALHVPGGDTPLRAADLLQQASHASIAADWIYRDWLRAQTACVRGHGAPAAARRADIRATRLKQRFLVVFDPLARRFGRKVWRADDF